jgi:hypothetical protein
VEHVVFYPGAEGAAFKRVASLEDAVRLVEHLRNVEGVAEVSVHSLTEVPMAFKAYYKVEVPGAAAAEPEAAPAAEPEPAEAPAEPVAVEAAAPEAAAEEVPAVEPVGPTAEAPAQDAPDASAEPVLAGAESNGHREVTGLGFFAS